MINLNCFRERLAAVLAGVLLMTAYSASAQEEEVADNYIPYPHAFIGIQAGGQTTFTDYDTLKLITSRLSLARACMSTAFGTKAGFAMTMSMLSTSTNTRRPTSM